MYFSTQNNDVSLEKTPKHTSMDHHKYGFIDQGKYRRRASRLKWTDREYHVQYKYDLAHKEVKIYFNTKQFPALPFCGTHLKPHGGNGLCNHYHLSFDPKLGHGICVICRIPCAWVACTSMLEQPHISDSSSKKQARYKPITNCTYWTFPGS